MQRIAMDWLVYRLTNSAFLLEVVGFTGQIPIFHLTPFAVVWLERGKKIKSYRWVILCIVYLSILAFALTLQSIPPILPLIISELHITYAQSGLLMGFFALPGLFVSLLGGFLSDRYRMRPLGIACFSFMIGGTLCVGLGMNLWILWLGRIISGIGALTLSTILPKLLSQWFREREEGLAMGIFNTGIPLGSIICFGLFGRMGSLWGWRLSVLLTGCYSFIVAISFLGFYKVPYSSPGVVAGREIDFHEEGGLAP